MKKIVKKWGSSLVIVFDKEDVGILKLKEGNIIELEIKKIEGK